MFTCPVCGHRSAHPDDERYRYCGHCHAFIDQVAPGCYAVNDELHVSIPELLDEFGWPDTPHNRDRAASIAEKVAAERGIPTATTEET